MTDHKNLTEALVAFQAALPDVSKGSTNPAFKSKYAALPDVTKAVFPELAKHGLAFTALPDVDPDHGYVMRYELRHISGETLTGVWPLPDGAKAQEYGSWITYGRRYALSAVTGITPDDDDDGNSTGPVAGSRRQTQPPARDRIARAVEAISGAPDDTELEKVWARVRQGGLDGVHEVKAVYENKKAAVSGTADPLVDHWAAAPIPEES